MIEIAIKTNTCVEIHRLRQIDCAMVLCWEIFNESNLAFPGPNSISRKTRFAHGSWFAPPSSTKYLRIWVFPMEITFNRQTLTHRNLVRHTDYDKQHQFIVQHWNQPVFLWVKIKTKTKRSQRYMNAHNLMNLLCVEVMHKVLFARSSVLSIFVSLSGTFLSSVECRRILSWRQRYKMQIKRGNNLWFAGFSCLF